MSNEIQLSTYDQKEISDLLKALRQFHHKMVSVGISSYDQGDRGALDWKQIAAECITDGNGDSIIKGDVLLRQCVISSLMKLLRSLEQAEKVFLTDGLLAMLTAGLEQRYRVNYTYRTDDTSYVTIMAKDENHARELVDKSLEDQSGHAWDEICGDCLDGHSEYESGEVELLN